MNSRIHTSDNIFCQNSSPILELLVKFASQICHEKTNKPLDDVYLADFGIEVSVNDACYDMLSRLKSEKSESRTVICLKFY